MAKKAKKIAPIPEGTSVMAASFDSKTGQILTNKPDASTPVMAYRLLRPLTEIPVFYSNQAQIKTTNHEVQIMFCQTAGKTPTELSVIPQATVYMSFAHAKKVAQIISKQLAVHEEKYGVIQLD